jgi:hypothetical protein
MTAQKPWESNVFWLLFFKKVTASFSSSRSLVMDPAYFTRYDQLRMRRDENGILEVRLHTKDGPCLFGPRTHEHMVAATPIRG